MLRFRVGVLRFRVGVLRFRVFGCFVLRSSFSNASFSTLPISGPVFCSYYVMLVLYAFKLCMMVAFFNRDYTTTYSQYS